MLIWQTWRYVNIYEQFSVRPATFPCTKFEKTEEPEKKNEKQEQIGRSCEFFE